MRLAGETDSSLVTHHCSAFQCFFTRCLFQLRICSFIRFCSLPTLRSLGFLPSLPFHPFEVSGRIRFILSYAPLFSFSVFFHPMLFQLRICSFIRFCSLPTLRLLGFPPSLPFHPLEVAGSSRFVLCYAPLFSFLMY